MNIDPATIKPVQIQTTLLFVNNFIINTTKFLNTFSESCDIKLSNISTKISNLDIVLSVLEAKLNSVPGLETDDIPPPSSTSNTSAPTSSSSTTTANENEQPSATTSDQSSDLVKASDHPDYVPFFKLSRLGVPMAVVSAKVTAAGLDPNVLEDPDAMISRSGGGDGGGGNSGPPPEQRQEQQQQSQETANSGMVKASEHPDYAPFFKLLRLGVPLPVVSGKVSAAGLDPNVLNDPDAMISPGGGGGGSSSSSNDGGGGGSAVVISGGALVVSGGASQPLSRRIFDKFDPGQSGHVGTGQFQAMALEFGVFLSGDALSLAVKMIDHDGNGTIEYAEFVSWFKQSSFSALSLDDAQLEERSSAAKLFRKYDDDNSGVIDVEEFRGLYKELKMMNLTSHSCETALEDIDADGNGSIEFNEFVDWLERH